MPDQNSQVGTTTTEEVTIPPAGSPQKAEQYLKQIIELIDQDKLVVKHTDLSRFDPSDLQDHYRFELKDYSVEVSHSKKPDSGEDSFVILFTNLKQIRDGCTEKSILAYMHLDQSQFSKFKAAASNHLARKKRQEEEQRFEAAMQPINQALEEVANQTVPEERFKKYFQNDSESKDGGQQPGEEPKYEQPEYLADDKNRQTTSAVN